MDDEFDLSLPRHASMKFTLSSLQLAALDSNVEGHIYVDEKSRLSKHICISCLHAILEGKDDVVRMSADGVCLYYRMICVCA